MSLLCNRYAKALFAAADQAGAVDAVLADLATIDEVLQDADAAAAVTSPDVPAAARGKVLDRLVADAHELTKSFVGVLRQRRRQDLLLEVHGAFRALVLAHRGELEGVVETPKPVSAEQLAALQALAGSLTGKTVSLSQHASPDLIGGVRLRVGNTLYDGSVATTLEELQKRLLAAPIG